MQPKFSLDILKACQESGIHTAIETCGSVQWDTLSEMLKYVDLMYVDIKHMSSSEHIKLTGKENGLILENIEKMAADYADIPLIIRIPIIPGHNDSTENIVNTARFVRHLRRAERIELLPYHKFGVHMYETLLRDYPLVGLVPPSEEQMCNLTELAKSCGIKVQIGG